MLMVDIAIPYLFGSCAKDTIHRIYSRATTNLLQYIQAGLVW